MISIMLTVIEISIKNKLRLLTQDGNERDTGTGFGVVEVTVR